VNNAERAEFDRGPWAKSTQYGSNQLILVRPGGPALRSNLWLAIYTA
jgi:hypothetical protein